MQRTPLTHTPRRQQQREKQCRLKVGAINAAALGPIKKQAHSHGREKEKILPYFVVISVVGKTIKSGSIRCHISKLKCTKFDFGWGSASYLAAGDYSAPPDLVP